MHSRLQILLVQSQAGKLTTTEQRELDEYEPIEYLMVMVKAGNLSYL